MPQEERRIDIVNDNHYAWADMAAVIRDCAVVDMGNVG